MSTMDALISVIVPVYNGERFINASLQSALAQSHSNLEILVADDGSTDKTVEVVCRAAQSDSRIRLLRGTHEGLPGRVRNRALREARGDFVALLDADDLWSPTKIEEQMKAVEARDDVAFCFTCARDFHGDSAPAPDLEARPREEASPPWAAEEFVGEAGIRRLLQRRVFICTSSVLFPRRLLDDIGYFSTSDALRSCEDLDFFIRAYFAGSVVFVPKVHTFVRKHSANISAGERWPSLFEMLKAAQGRGHIPEEMSREVWGDAWIVRGEETLGAGAPGWRSAMARAWRLQPLNVRRLPALLTLLLPQPAAKSFYAACKASAPRP